jgi:ribosomal protein S18 acetylase RimI-like enzyme
VRPVTRVEEATSVSDELVAAVGRLVRQLSTSAPSPRWSDLDQIVSSPTSSLLIARDAEGRIVGMLTLATFRIPTGMRAWIEDVVVDQAARGQGVGEALSKRALEAAAEAGAKTVELTSRPSREAANRLYRRLGFQERETNVYRYDCLPAS